jgi:transcription factor C subunit 3
MNMVLQPLIFQPGVTAMEIHAHCPNNTVEIFEIELMLGWLESVNAVRKTVGGGYMTMPGAWASFGETLLEMENDWLNDHIERKTKRHQRQVWRDQYALQYSNMRQRAEDHEGPQSYVLEKETEARHNRDVVSSTSQQILRNPSLQYAFLQQSQSASGSQDQLGASEQAAVQTKTNAASAQLSAQAIASHSPGGFDKTSGDIEMGGTDTGSRDVDVNTGGEADKRAEENVEESMDEGM